MKDKFNLTLQENVFLAKKTLVHNIYSSARLEGCNVTFPQTETILKGINLQKVPLSEIECILNLRNAWNYILNNIGEPFNLNYILKVNDHVARGEALEWGVLRNGGVGITGTKWIPPVPKKDKIEESLISIFSKPTATEQALEYFLFGCKYQLFWDGNKRTSNICANNIMIQGGAGVLTVAEGDDEEYNRLLIHYYSTDDKDSIKDFLYEKCIYGLTRERDKEQVNIENKELEQER